MITQISFEYRVGMFQGTEQFKKSLSEHYNVHERPIWMPAAGGNYEMWIEIFVNTNIIDFIKGAIVGGIVYDLSKHLIFKPFIDALNKLEKANENPLEIQKYIFHFEDTEVVIYGLTTNFNSIFSGIFKELFADYHSIKEASEYGDIHEIEIPVSPDSGRNEWWIGAEEIEPYLTFWNISIGNGVDNFIWDVKNKQIYNG